MNPTHGNAQAGGTALGAEGAAFDGLPANSITPNVPRTFDFNGTPLRVIEINGEPWFIAVDVCTALGIRNATQSVGSLDADERSMFNIGRQGEVNVVSESGLFALFLRCRNATKPGSKAHRFRRWVTSEVLPALRRTGSYTIDTPPPQFEIPRTLADALRLAANQVEQIEAQAGQITRQASVIEHQRGAISEAKSAVAFVQNFVSTDGLRGLQNTGLELGLGPNKFIARLKADGFLHYRGRSLVPKVEFTHRGIFEVREHIGGTGDGRLQTYITARGLEFFAAKYAAEIAITRKGTSHVRT